MLMVFVMAVIEGGNVMFYAYADRAESRPTPARATPPPASGADEGTRHGRTFIEATQRRADHTWTTVGNIEILGQAPGPTCIASGDGIGQATRARPCQLAEVAVHLQAYEPFTPLVGSAAAGDHQPASGL